MPAAYAAPRFLPAGEAALVVELGDAIDDRVNGRVMALDRAIAGTGIFIAYQMYLKKRWSPDRVAGLAGGRLYDLVYNKYYVDEIYQRVFVDGLLAVTRAMLPETPTPRVSQGSSRKRSSSPLPVEGSSRRPTLNK